VAGAQDIELPDVEAPCAPEVTENRRAILSVDGASGFWFQQEVARCMLGRLQVLPLYARHVQILEERLVLSDSRHASMQRLRELAEEGEERAVEALSTALQRQREAEGELDVWYRHPALWAGLGAAAVVGLELVAVLLLRELDASP
jgi:hypothetical protein